MLKDTPLLIIMEDSLVKVTYKQPRANNNESKVNVVVSKIGTQGWVGVHACTGRSSITRG
jgi:hypothetical protein